ncbi:polyribonucleotide nucleotidyltransferase [Stratiformator vulcanicus]|uniref:polyribonucleotide nucleotidyltransferase n=1 Tax=Stratiformator vulcanicus TaxID=2527980 RepID=UPI0011A3FAAF|nr:polyribonucleotide nucleotidyltransferase [Stratiformator vulcanicus]
MSDQSPFPQPVSVEREIGGRTFKLTTGEIAKQASGAVLVQFGDTVLFVAAQHGPPRPGIDFFPLQVDYRERLAAAGKFAGGFLKREGRPTTREILTARVTDRPLRPLFPKGYKDEIQVQANVLSSDGENDPSPLCATGASTALMIAEEVPFGGPISSVRVGRVDGELVLFPTHEEMMGSDLDLTVAGSKESVLMIEGFANQLPEAEMAEAIMFAHESCVELCELQFDLMKAVGIEPTKFEGPPENPFTSTLQEKAYDKVKEAKTSGNKQERADKVSEIKDGLVSELFPEDAEETSDGNTKAQFKEAFYKLEAKVVRDLLLEGKRLDGRSPDDLRAVDSRVSLLPRVHGSALFTRGETQSMMTVTLGTSRDQQRVDGLFGESAERFMLHYYFPSYSVGEVRPIRGPGRREIGHGVLAERSVFPVIPKAEKFPYTIRCISDITESNGSSSMASVCAATLGLMDAGVPILQPVAGISIGIVKESNDKYTLLTDIMGDEDHFGDMDFKVAGTQKGITGIQLDLKIDGISEQIIKDTLVQARKARIELLRVMLSAIRRPRGEISSFAPRLLQIKIDPEKIGLLIGPGGKTIRAIQEESGATLDVEDDGTVTIAANNGEAAEAALARVEALTEEIKVGRIYEGTVSSIKDFGAFVEIAPGKDGLCHISELSDGFVKNVTDICKVGDKLRVKVIAVDEQNRVKLSRKAVMEEESDGDGGDDEEE